ncbi:ATP phosphoribosyltransferase [Cystobasidium minutum MCA 4210]|uniref:ATP phosphoribosyltransferase n=1 Tax=Cystobasidium minutum MCA 4210 TaxID=1397322 RepID=UPI0034CDF986|eukprot:jgi/Rhomi1/172020/fgenesh1_kg.4_\
MDFLSESLKGRLLFAIPKKGRLYEQCLTLLSGADIQFTRSHRLDVCLVRNHNLALVFLPAADIPRFVGEGNVDLGITGQDMVAEASAAEVNLSNTSSTPSTSGSASPSVGNNGQATNGTATVKLSDLIEEVLPLGFGSCRLQVQVPERSSDLKSVEDLVGKRVATSFDGLSTQLFKELDAKVNAERGLSGSSKLKTKIEYVGGSVEAACALGVADGIVDLVESGETMRAAGLHAIHTLMTSEAVLIRSKRSRNGGALNEADTSLINKITSRIAGVIAASKYVLCEYNVPRKNLDAATSITPGRRAATVSPLDDPDWVAVSSMVLKKNLADVMDKLTETGATDILVIGINNCRV